MNGNRLLQRARELAPVLVDLRRSLHREPELGFEEERTRRMARLVLTEHAAGVTFTEVATTGLIAELDGFGPTVLLRACLDALPIDDPKTTEYASMVPGKAHACGHDAQVAALVGAMILLSESPPKVSVRALFQPAEEIDTGARAVLESGVLEAMRPSVILGFHGHPALSAGEIAVASGSVMACITTLRCQINGHGGHGAEPHLTADPITAMAAMINDFQVAVGRRIDPRQPVVLSIGRVVAGKTPNVIPDSVTMEGTLRYLDSAVSKELEAALRDVAAAVELRTGVSVELELEQVVPAVVNNAGVARLVADAATEILGSEALRPLPLSLAGDDFAFLLQRAPGCYFFVGERQAGREPYGWHDPAYDLDESSIPIASAVLAMACVRAAEGSIA